MRVTLCKTLLLFGFLVVSHIAISQTPIEFNNKLVSVNDSLFIMGQQWGKKFNEVKPVKEYSKLASARQQLESYITRKLAEVRSMKDVAGSKEFREGMIDFLLFERKLIEVGFKPIEKLTGSSTDAEVKTAIDGLIQASKDENTKLETFRKLQAAYAEKNGFKIEGQ